MRSKPPTCLPGCNLPAAFPFRMSRRKACRSSARWNGIDAIILNQAESVLMSGIVAVVVVEHLRKSDDKVDK